MAFGERFPPAKWRDFLNTGVQWKLLSFDEKKPETWEEFWQSQRSYWGVDNPDARRKRPWFWETFTEELFLNEAKTKYEDRVLHCSRWCGVINIGQAMQAASLGPNRIALSRNWSGEIADHEDLDIHLHRQYKYFIFPKSLMCNVYTYGTLFLEPSSQEVVVSGAKSGLHKVQHSMSDRFGKHDYTAAIGLEIGQIRIWDAHFQIIE